MTLTPETRAHLTEELAKLAAAEKQVEAEMAPLREMMKPFNDRLDAIEASRDELLDRFGASVAGYCEVCNKLLLSGDKGHSCADGPILCEDHAPTYRALQRQLEEATEEGDSEWIRATSQDIADHLTSGGTVDDKILHTL